MKACTAGYEIVSLTAAKFKPFVFQMYGFSLSSSTHIGILMILDAVPYLPVQLPNISTEEATLEQDIMITSITPKEIRLNEDSHSTYYKVAIAVEKLKM
jgi:hypothetical protein